MASSKKAKSVKPVIDPKKVEKAYVETGLKPARSLWHSEGAACPLAVLYRAAGKPFCSSESSDEKKIRRWAREAMGVSNKFLDGFVEAVDSNTGLSYEDMDEDDSSVSKDYLRGFRTGELVRQSLETSGEF